MSKPIIMTIDDEPAVLNAIERDLRRQYGEDFRIMKATSGQEALDAVAELGRRNERVALFLTDQRMPNMTGTQLAEKMIEIRPDIPVILCSGFPEKICPEELKNIGIKEFIAKPIGKQEIAAIVRKVLDESKVTV